VANFTRATQRVAKDGGDSTQPADETKTENDKVQVHITIRSDDETRKQVSLTVVAKAVDVALDEAKTAAMASAGTEILSSSLNKAPEGQSSAQLSVRVPGTGYSSLMEAFKALGRTASLSIQRSDDSGPGANGDDAPVIVTLALTDDDAPLQQTAMTVAAQDVDAQSQQIKKAAGDAGVEVKASSFQHQTDGTELAQMTFRLPMAKYPAFLESVKALGKVESLTVQRNDRPDETQTDDTAPAEITLQLHNQRDLIADDDGFWATMSKTFGEGAGALLTSVRVIGVIVAFVVPWALTLGVMAWVGRRIYVWRKKKV
jgi:glycine cleavage system regulatory protein